MKTTLIIVSIVIVGVVVYYIVINNSTPTVNIVNVNWDNGTALAQVGSNMINCPSNLGVAVYPGYVVEWINGNTQIRLRNVNNGNTQILASAPSN